MWIKKDSWVLPSALLLLLLCSRQAHGQDIDYAISLLKQAQARLTILGQSLDEREKDLSGREHNLTLTEQLLTTERARLISEAELLKAERESLTKESESLATREQYLTEREAAHEQTEKSLQTLTDSFKALSTRYEWTKRGLWAAVGLAVASMVAAVVF